MNDQEVFYLFCFIASVVVYAPMIRAYFKAKE